MKQSYGFRSWAGMGRESAWGEAAARTAFAELTADSLRAVREKVFSQSFRGRSKRRYVRGREGAAGSLGFEAAFEGQELLWEQIFGSVESEFLADGGAGHWRHAMSLADEPNSSLTLELHRDAFDPELAGGSGAPSSFLYTGCRVDEAAFLLEPDAMLRLDATFAARNETLAEASTPVFADSPLVDFAQAALEIGGEPREAQSFELRLRQRLNADRRALGTREILPPIPGGARELDGSVKLFFDRLDDARAFAEGEESSLRLSFTGPPVSPGGAPYSLVLDCSRIVLKGQTPAVDGAGALSMTLDFEALEPSGGGSPLTAELRNAVEFS